MHATDGQAEPSLGGTPHDPYAALRSRDFRLLLGGTPLVVIAEQIIGVTIGWELYQRTNSAFALGLIGLVQIVPVILLALPAGHLADRLDRKRIAMAAMAGLALCACGLAAISATVGPLWLVYLCLLGNGIARAFHSPAISSLTSQVVPAEHFSSAATWESGSWQASSIVGPALGGYLVAAQSPTLAYSVAGVMLLLAAALMAFLRPRPVARSDEQVTISSLLAGARWIWKTKIILASMSLDMFAVLLGGATALLPIFARDILHVGAEGLGWLRTAPAAGALLAALVIAYLPPFRHAGRTLLLVVAGFGVVTIVFGLSTSFVLSLAMLAALGALDNISVVIRSTLMLTRTPDDMRGRVNALHFMFIGISNELGAFESGIAAALLGTIGAVVAGGIGTILVVAAIATIWPDVRKLGRLDKPLVE